MKLRGLWWWIDRWRKSTAYTDMTLEEQGAYRNLLDDAALRGGGLPNDEHVLAKACGDPRRWRRVRPRVMTHFTLEADGWHNTTLDEVIARSKEIRAERATAGRSGAATRWQTDGKRDGKRDGKSIANVMASESVSVKEQEQKEQKISAEPSNGSTPPVLEFPIVGTSRTSWGLTSEQIIAWSDAFPGVSVEGECRRALVWLEAQPARRKTAGGMPRFLVAWLNRATDRPSGPRRDQPRGAAPMPVHAQVDCPHVAGHTNAAACLLACHLGQPRADGRAVRRWTEADAREGFTGLVMPDKAEAV